MECAFTSPVRTECGRFVLYAVLYVLCLCMGRMSVLSCRCCMFVSCVHPVAVLNAAFCMTCSLLMLVEDARGDHMEEAYSRAGLMTALKVARVPPSVYPILFL